MCSFDFFRLVYYDTGEMRGKISTEFTVQHPLNFYVLQTM